jgi:hypothetical protein
MPSSKLFATFAFMSIDNSGKWFKAKDEDPIAFFLRTSTPDEIQQFQEFIASFSKDDETKLHSRATELASEKFLQFGPGVNKSLDMFDEPDRKEMMNDLFKVVLLDTKRKLLLEFFNEKNRAS